MKKLIPMQEAITAKTKHIKTLYGLDYLSVDNYSITAGRRTASLYYSKYSDKVEITPVCNKDETPTTYEEFIQAKQQHQLDADHLQHIATIWKKAIS